MARSSWTPGGTVLGMLSSQSSFQSTVSEGGLKRLPPSRTTSHCWTARTIIRGSCTGVVVVNWQRNRQRVSRGARALRLNSVPTLIHFAVPRELRKTTLGLLAYCTILVAPAISVSASRTTATFLHVKWVLRKSCLGLGDIAYFVLYPPLSADAMQVH